MHGESNVWNVSQREKRFRYLIVMLDLNEAVDQLAITNTVC